MSRVFALAAVVFLAAPVSADDKDWTGKTIKLTADVKLGRKLGGGLVRDGAALDKGKTFVVKSDDGSYLELVGQTGYVFKSEAEMVAGREMPKKGDPVAKEDKNLWVVGTKVLQRIDSDKIQFGDRDADGKQVYFKIADLGVTVVQDNGDGWVRVRDRSREGWVSKDDFVTAADAPIYFDKAVKADPKNSWALFMRAEGWSVKGEYDNAIKDYTDYIRLVPDSSAAYNNRGAAWRAKKEYDKAIDDYTEAIRLDPKYAIAYNNRGAAWHDKKEYDKAIADYTEAIRLDPKYAIAYNNRGQTWDKKKEYQKALADYEKAAEINPNDVDALNGLAWRYATCPDASIRDGKKAIEFAKKAVKLSDSGNGRDTLAAAYAEAGDFELAVSEQRKALEDKSLSKDSRKEMEARLELYKAKKPYRDDE